MKKGDSYYLDEFGHTYSEEYLAVTAQYVAKGQLWTLSVIAAMSPSFKTGKRKKFDVKFNPTNWGEGGIFAFRVYIEHKIELGFVWLVSPPDKPDLGASKLPFYNGHNSKTPFSKFKCEPYIFHRFKANS